MGTCAQQNRWVAADPPGECVSRSPDQVGDDPPSETEAAGPPVAEPTRVSAPRAPRPPRRRSGGRRPAVAPPRRDIGATNISPSPTPSTNVVERRGYDRPGLLGINQHEREVNLEPAPHGQRRGDEVAGGVALGVLAGDQIHGDLGVGVAAEFRPDLHRPFGRRAICQSQQCGAEPRHVNAPA